MNPYVLDEQFYSEKLCKNQEPLLQLSCQIMKLYSLILPPACSL